jgi:adenylate cyclase
LAIFPIGPGVATEAEACEAALLAARDAEERLAHANRRRMDTGFSPLAFGLGLHVGTVTYGNIGVPERLQFTVVGAAVNEVARLEALTKMLDRRALVSAEFASKLSVAWEPLGQYELRGLADPREVFAPPPAGHA